MTIYSIGEISKIVQEEQHILRYWEKTFKVVSPEKDATGARVYSEEDLVKIKTLKKLLREDLLSVNKVKDKIKKGEVSFNNSSKVQPDTENSKDIKETDLTDKKEWLTIKPSELNSSQNIQELRNTQDVFKNVLNEIENILANLSIIEK
ncbi:MAG: hypothetical protein Kapaf2KO_14450 [Candidatus Kapaibacteriales bacterium]